MERMEIFPKEWREWRVRSAVAPFIFFWCENASEKKKNGEKNGENGDFSKRMERMEKK